MRVHQWSSPTDYEAKIIQGFEVLEPNHYTLAGNEQPRDYRAPVKHKQTVRRMLFTGFKRCCYPYQKFDSVEGELMLARILEADASVLKWMKPASGKFRIEYQSGKRYEPDFVVETKDCCLLIEPKRADEINTDVVQAKKRAAQRWCQYANDHAKQIDAKFWYYLLIPHDEILSNISLDRLITQFN
jgi:type III restriction enzyme